MTTNERQAYEEALNRIEEYLQKASPGKKLFLSELGLSALPPEIGQLSTLTTLHLQKNKLRELPPEIGKLTSLRHLYLSKNELRALPPEIGKLTALTVLFLHSNKLSELPPDIGKLTSLTTLRLGKNRLVALPPEIDQLSGLKGLYLHNNHGLRLPAELLGPTWKTQAKPKPPKEILNYYFGFNPDHRSNNSPATIVNYMSDDHSIHIGHVTNSQIGQTLTNCTNMIQELASGEQKQLLEELETQVKQLIERLPDDKKEHAPKIARDLKMLIEQSTSKEPDREWYSLSAKGLLDAAKWVVGLTVPITQTVIALNKFQS